jgi:hypothetical protein
MINKQKKNHVKTEFTFSCRINLNEENDLKTPLFLSLILSIELSIERIGLVMANDKVIKQISRRGNCQTFMLYIYYNIENQPFLIFFLKSTQSFTFKCSFYVQMLSYLFKIASVIYFSFLLMGVSFRSLLNYVNKEVILFFFLSRNFLLFTYAYVKMHRLIILNFIIDYSLMI